MLNINDIAISVSCQQFLCNAFSFNETSSSATLRFESTQKTEDIVCPDCGAKVYSQARASTVLKDAPVFSGIMQEMRVLYHRYQCTSCQKVFSEDLGLLRYPGTRVTHRAAKFIKDLLKLQMPISAVSLLTGIRWNTVCKIHEEIMQEVLDARKAELEKKEYKPKRLAVDEFAIHKGHTYATCVMDLDEGDVIWAGMGRTIEKFEKFFEDMAPEYLSEVKVVAMDMNASYASVVQEKLPEACIVYDRFHIQAQYGKDVLGSVRLAEAKSHQEIAKQYDKEAAEEEDPAKKKELKEQAKIERSHYTTIKRSRWTLLTAKTKLSEKRSKALDQILADHEQLSTCYAMKEEMIDLFQLRDQEAAKEGWKNWFQAAKESGIPQLVKFAELKEKRIDGLVAHALYPVSTGKLEGFNNKIKVAKRIGYGYRKDTYFFTLIRYLSLPSTKSRFHTNC